MDSVSGLIIFAVAVTVALLLLFRLLAPRRSAARQPTLEFAITFDSAGFVLADQRLHPGADLRLSWQEIGRVVAYKRDRFAYDRLCLFVARADGSGVELSEEMDGWKAFCGVLPQVLPGCKPSAEWFLPVTFPAFATNKTELYVRS